jgi:outer membrane lipoprotein-sorting protein
MRIAHRGLLLLITSLAAATIYTSTRSLAASNQAAQQQAQQLIQKNLKAESVTNYKGREVITTKVGSNSMTQVRLVFHRKPDQYRWEYERLAANGNHIVVDDGKTLWSFDADSDVIRQEDSYSSEGNAIPWQKRKQLLISNYNLDLLGYEEWVGRQVGVVLLSPKYLAPDKRNALSAKLWIDTATGLTLKAERFGVDGQPNSIQYYTEFSTDPSLRDDLFAPKLSKGTEIIKFQRAKPINSIDKLAERAKQSIKLPEQLSLGFEFSTGNLVKYDNRSILTMVYSDGLATVSVFQTFPPSGQRVSKMSADGDTVIYQLSVEDSDITVVGNIDQDSMAKLVDANIKVYLVPKNIPAYADFNSALHGVGCPYDDLFRVSRIRPDSDLFIYFEVLNIGPRAYKNRVSGFCGIYCSLYRDIIPFCFRTYP